LEAGSNRNFNRGQIIYWLLFAGFFLYVVLNYETLQAQSFELAKVSALLGGFALTGGFSGIKTHDILKFRLRRIGTLFIVSTIFFVVFGLYQPLDQPDSVESLKNILKIVIPISFYGGVIFFLIATSLLFTIIPRIFREK
jgi:F0F1-type ATP synthase alpha subunit